MEGPRLYRGPIKPILSEEQKKALAAKLARKKWRETPLSATLGEAMKLAFRKRKK